jgi:hypothetical protein
MEDMNPTTKQILVAIAIFIPALALSALITMLLWNWVVPPIFNGPRINYNLAIGLSLFIAAISSAFKAAK